MREGRGASLVPGSLPNKRAHHPGGPILPLPFFPWVQKLRGVRGNESLYRGKHRSLLPFDSLESLRTMRIVLRLMLEHTAFYGLP